MSGGDAGAAHNEAGNATAIIAGRLERSAISHASQCVRAVRALTALPRERDFHLNRATRLIGCFHHFLINAESTRPPHCDARLLNHADRPFFIEFVDH